MQRICLYAESALLTWRHTVPPQLSLLLLLLLLLL
jgi:hypothetical protein